MTKNADQKSIQSLLNAFRIAVAHETRCSTDYAMRVEEAATPALKKMLTDARMATADAELRLLDAFAGGER